MLHCLVPEDNGLVAAGGMDLVAITRATTKTVLMNLIRG